MLAYLIIVACIPAMIMAYPIVPCPGGLPPPLDIRISACNTSPCIVNASSTFSYEFDFVAPHDSSDVFFRLFRTVFGETTELTLEPELRNACNGLTPQCPIQLGVVYIHAATVQVSSEFHDGIPVTLRFQVDSDDGHRHHHTCACAIVNIWLSTKHLWVN